MLKDLRVSVWLLSKLSGSGIENLKSWKLMSALWRILILGTVESPLVFSVSQLLVFVYLFSMFK